MELGMNIRKLREKAGLSQTELAKRAGIDQTTISKIESGQRRKVQAQTLVLIALALKTTVEELRNESSPTTDIVEDLFEQMPDLKMFIEEAYHNPDSRAVLADFLKLVRATPHESRREQISQLLQAQKIFQR